MARSAAKLQIVGTNAEVLPVEPEQELTLLFDQEATLQLQLAKVRAALESARKRYSDDGRPQALPRMDLLRTRFGPASKGPRA